MRHMIGVLVLFLGLNAFAVREVQNGGGGVNTNGQLETFFSANFRLEDQPEDAQKIPGLARLIAEIDALPIKAYAKGRLLEVVFPTADRNYYRIKGGEFDPITRRRVAAEYARILGVPADKVVFFAASSPQSKTTVLMNEFYKLKEVEQAVILLHEGLWIYNATLEYTDVLSLEQDAQAYFQDHSNTKALLSMITKLSDVFSDRSLPLSATMALDYKAGIFPVASSNPNTVRLVDLVGPGYLDCMFLHDFSNHKSRIAEIDYVRNCNQIIQYYSVMQASKYPQATYFQALTLYLSRFGTIDVLDTYRDTTHLSGSLAKMNYESFRDSIYVDIQQPMGGTKLDLKIYNGENEQIGRLRF
ncbi:hypothetical protein DOM22_06775 [Bdellovibrio sp. ZAP7]|uniref:hypothetical protein n=1 Tax=Bdellovibrio sp. ZAP7 TaxID=2231053 RepID=UPI001158098E|nr:hypothetical protein [Bdellovibrio sp. ZAP7]QDK44886.1 hypothetical protein DOM22_06775 [Bdellovibrio sp. ZAP7]